MTPSAIVGELTRSAAQGIELHAIYKDAGRSMSMAEYRVMHVDDKKGIITLRVNELVYEFQMVVRTPEQGFVP